ncbi:MAG: hypothetical protein WBC70_01780 [Candidatus Aminicenantales bacterium]
MRKKPAAIAVIAYVLFAWARAGATPSESRPRNFVLFFEVLEYSKELGDAVSFFLGRILDPGDQLVFYTPTRAYSFSRETLAVPKKDLIHKLQGHLRGDTAVGGTDYKILMEDMLGQARDVENAPDQNALRRALTAYRQSLNDLRLLRKVNEGLLADIVGIFKGQTGEKHIILTYQAEFRPIPDRDTLTKLRAMPIVSFEANELFFEADTKPPLDAELFIGMLRETGILLHFFYIKPKSVFMVQNCREQSVDMFNVFARIAAASGGIVETTAAPEAAFRALLKTLNAPLRQDLQQPDSRPSEAPPRHAAGNPSKENRS